MSMVDTQMDTVSQVKLQELLTPQTDLVLSMYMPAYRRGPEVQQNVIRFKNLLTTAAQRLQQQGIDEQRVETMLAPAYALVDDSPFWQQQSDGLAIFVNGEEISTYRLPIPFTEDVFVGHYFYVRPVLDMWNDGMDFFVLELSQGHVSLWQGDRYELREVELADDVPTSLEEALRYDDIESHLQFHTGTGRSTDSGDRGAMFHGHGGSQEAGDKENLLRFFRALDNGVRDAIADNQAPLVLIGVDMVQGAYRQANHHDGLVEEGVSINPQELDGGEAHARAWEVVAPLLQQKQDESLDVFMHLHGNNEERATTSVGEAVSAAWFQRVDTLFVAENEQRWGTFDMEANQTTLHDEEQPGDSELLNFAITHTLLNGGRVFNLDESSMPASAPVAAILRY